MRSSSPVLLLLLNATLHSACGARSDLQGTPQGTNRASMQCAADGRWNEGAPVLLEQDAEPPYGTAVWNGTRFGVLYSPRNNGRPALVFRSIGLDGTTSEPRVLTGRVESALLRWTGSYFVAAWIQAGRWYVQLLDGEGTPLRGSARDVSPRDLGRNAYLYDLLLDDRARGYFWSDDRVQLYRYRLYFSTASEAWEPSGETLLIDAGNFEQTRYSAGVYLNDRYHVVLHRIGPGTVRDELQFYSFGPSASVASSAPAFYTAEAVLVSNMVSLREGIAFALWDLALGATVLRFDGALRVRDTLRLGAMFERPSLVAIENGLAVVAQHEHVSAERANPQRLSFWSVDSSFRLGERLQLTSPADGCVSEHSVVAAGCAVGVLWTVALRCGTQRSLYWVPITPSR